MICGGGHVAAALVRMAKLLDFEIWVLGRPPRFFAEHAKTGGEQITFFCGDYVESLAKNPERCG